MAKKIKNKKNTFFNQTGVSSLAVIGLLGAILIFSIILLALIIITTQPVEKDSREIKPLKQAQNNSTSSTTQNIAPGADTNNNGLPDDIEQIIIEARSSTATPNINIDTNNNGLPDDVESVLKNQAAKDNTASNTTTIIDKNNNGIPDDVEALLKP
ncbi:MAG: hypothetical protein WCX71_03380 [Candidatus Buchananbacteria bacterium]